MKPFPTIFIDTGIVIESKQDFNQQSSLMEKIKEKRPHINIVIDNIHDISIDDYVIYIPINNLNCNFKTIEYLLLLGRINQYLNYSRRKKIFLITQSFDLLIKLMLDLKDNVVLGSYNILNAGFDKASGIISSCYVPLPIIDVSYNQLYEPVDINDETQGYKPINLFSIISKSDKIQDLYTLIEKCCDYIDKYKE